MEVLIVSKNHFVPLLLFWVNYTIKKATVRFNKVSHKQLMFENSPASIPLPELVAGTGCAYHNHVGLPD